jgi:HEAT repeat protein
MHAVGVLTQTERRAVLDAIHFYGWLPRREIDRVRDQADRDLPFDLIARAAVEDEDSSVRWQSVLLLDHYDDDRHAGALQHAAHDPVARVRRHAVHALGCDACKRTVSCTDPVPTLADRALHDENTKVRRHATWSLIMRLPDARARAALEQVATTDSDQRVRRDAAWAAARETPCRSPED